MIHPTLDAFAQLATQGNLMPLWRELPADLDTPVSVYLKLRAASHAGAFLLESVEGGEQLARYSFIGVDPSRVFTIRGGACRRWAVTRPRRRRGAPSFRATSR